MGKSVLETIAEVARKTGEKAASQSMEKSIKRFYRTVGNGLTELINEGIITENTSAGEVLLICEKKGESL